MLTVHNGFDTEGHDAADRVLPDTLEGSYILCRKRRHVPTCAGSVVVDRKLGVGSGGLRGLCYVHARLERTAKSRGSFASAPACTSFTLAPHAAYGRSVQQCTPEQTQSPVILT